MENKNRKRKQTLSFRVSPEEKAEIDGRVKLSGLPIGEYFRKTFLEQKINIVAGLYESDRLAYELNKLRDSIFQMDISGRYNKEVRELLSEIKFILIGILVIHKED